MNTMVEYAVFGGLCLLALVLFVKDQRRGKTKKLPFSLYVVESKKCQSTIESRLFNALWNRGHYIKTQYKIGKYRLDMAIPDLKLAIEADGEFWHYSTPEQIEKDKKRDAYLRSLGWKTLRFPGKRIKKDALGCALEVEAEIDKALHS